MLVIQLIQYPVYQWPDFIKEGEKLIPALKKHLKAPLHCKPHGNSFHLQVNQLLPLQQLVKDLNMGLQVQEKAAEAQPEISWHACRPIIQSI